MPLLQTAATEEALQYLADELPKLSAVEISDLTAIEETVGHDVFERLVAEAGYAGAMPQLAPPRWSEDLLGQNNTLRQAQGDMPDKLGFREKSNRATSAENPSTPTEDASTADNIDGSVHQRHETKSRDDDMILP